ncbi:MAG: TldD/PmbA family protein [Firmicutes bacterium]|jgi:PmbA protein|nr:TldD/PmbA family protein [Bacillota bacterium]
MDLREFKELVFAAGCAAGLEDMEIYAVRSKELEVRVFQAEVDDYSLTNVIGVGFRARYAGRVGYAYTESIDQAAVQFLVDAVKANAAVIDSDDEIEFFPGSPAYPEVETYNQELDQVAAQAYIQGALELEREALAAHDKVDLVNWAVTGYSSEEVFIANTKGLEQEFRRNLAYAYVSAVVKDGDQVKTGHRFRCVPDWDQLRLAELAREAAGEGLSLLNAQTVPSGSYRIILRRDVARDILATFSGVFSADAVQKGFSLLGDKLGDQIAAEPVTLVDNPLLPKEGGSRPFDGEGVAVKQTNVISRGQLVSFLHNLKTARKAGVETTGNANRASFKSPVSIAPTNFYIMPGGSSYDELVARLEDGLIIINVQGLHSGANPVSGDFSLGAYGYRVENGRVTGAVDQITISGNFFSLLQDVEEIGSDLEFGIPSSGSNVGSPSLLIRALAVAGK